MSRIVRNCLSYLRPRSSAGSYLFSRARHLAPKTFYKHSPSYARFIGRTSPRECLFRITFDTPFPSYNKSLAQTAHSVDKE